MNSATVGLCVASMLVSIVASLTTTAVQSLEQDPLMRCFALALCVALHGAVALIVRGVRRP